jgi:hypothetical protein
VVRRGCTSVVVGTLVLVASCGRPGKMHMLATPAHGRPATCPDDAVDPYGTGMPSSMQARCSYDDMARNMTRLGGKVVTEGEPGNVVGVGVPDVIVTVHRARGPAGMPGERVAHATTDRQGGFHLAAILEPGEYLVVVRAQPDARPLASRRFSLGGNRVREIEDLLVVLPRDPRLE